MPDFSSSLEVAQWPAQVSVFVPEFLLQPLCLAERDLRLCLSGPRQILHLTGIADRIHSINLGKKYQELRTCKSGPFDENPACKERGEWESYREKVGKLKQVRKKGVYLRVKLQAEE